MAPEEDAQEIELTQEQYDELVKLGVKAQELEGMSMADAEEMIDELRSMRNPPSAR